jgi:DNA-binding IclR family transcriptional regulator
LAKSIEKALRLLELLARSETPLGVTEIARLLGLNKATAYRLLETLTRHGYVVRRLGPPRYEPTLKLWELGSAVLSRRDIVRVAQPVIEQVAEQTGETVFLAVPDGHDAVYVAKIDTEHPLRTFTPIGGRVPLHCGSTGKAILAFRSDAFIEEVARDLVGFTPATITTRDGLWREMLDIRRQGYAVNQDEWRPGISGVAAPIRDSSGAVIGSVGVTGPSERLPLTVLSSLGDPVVEAGRRISQELGYGGRDIAAPAPERAAPRGVARGAH